MHALCALVCLAAPKMHALCALVCLAAPKMHALCALVCLAAPKMHALCALVCLATHCVAPPPPCVATNTEANTSRQLKCTCIRTMGVCKRCTGFVPGIFSYRFVFSSLPLCVSHMCVCARHLFVYLPSRAELCVQHVEEPTGLYSNHHQFPSSLEYVSRWP